MMDAVVVVIDKAFDPLFALVESLPEPKYEPETCQHSIICECERRSCPGRTLSTKYYTRKLRDA